MTRRPKLHPRLLLSAAVLVGAVAAIAPAAGAASKTTSSASASIGGESLTLPGEVASSNGNIENLETGVLKDVDSFWTRTLERNGYSDPQVTYEWIPAGQSVTDACSGQPTDNTTAFYCPADDTIYLSDAFMSALRDGQVSGFPSGTDPKGPLGDMAVAYVIAHEYGHNIQNELGYDNGQIPTTNLELHADCLAGAWAADAASRGVTTAQDLTEAKDTAFLVGDYAYDNPDHHGTPAQRQAAFTAGTQSLSSCQQYLTETIPNS